MTQEQTTLREITTSYDGKCAKCNRDLRKGWKVFYDSTNKKVYCTKCGKEQGGASGNAPMVMTRETWDKLTPDAQQELMNAGVQEPKVSIEDSLQYLVNLMGGEQNDIQGIHDAIGAINEAMTKIFAQMSLIDNDLSQLYDKLIIKKEPVKR
jgi:DNA-directed RNA polymerase subunit RPC12/RpoP